MTRLIRNYWQIGATQDSCRRVSGITFPESRQYWRRLAKFTALCLVVAALALFGSFVYLQVKTFTTPHRQPVSGSPADYSLTFQDVTFTTTDGLKLSGWYIPGRLPDAIILVHGIDANRTVLLPEAALLNEAGYHLLLLDLRGHGQSEGAEVTYGYREALDIQAGVDFLLAQAEVKQVAALGISLGGSAVVRAAAIDSRLRGIVVESSFSSLSAAVDDAFEGRSVFPRWPFAPLLIWLAERRVNLQVSQVDSTRDITALSPRPVLIIHGTADHDFPPAHALRMYEAAQEPKDLWLVEGLGHASPILADEAGYRKRLFSFFERAFSN